MSFNSISAKLTIYDALGNIIIEQKKHAIY